MNKFNAEIKRFNNDIITTSAVACTNESYEHYKITDIGDTYFEYDLYNNKQFVTTSSTYGNYFADYTSANIGDWYYANPDYDYENPNSFPYIKCTGDHSDYTHN